MCFASQFEGTSKRAGRAGQQEHEVLVTFPLQSGEQREVKAYAQLASLVQSCVPSVACI